MNKLKKLKEDFNIKTNYEIDKLNDGPNIYVANYNSYMDMFYLPSSLDNNVVNIIDTRLCYEKSDKRIDKYLYTFPIEKNESKKITNIYKYYASKLLQNNIDILMFPEGINNANNIYKGKTGATQILFSYMELTAKKANLIPVAISNNEITFLNPINYCIDFYKYNKTKNNIAGNNCLHLPIDRAMQKIANRLNKDYIDEYIETYPRNNVMFENKELIDSDKLTNEDINRYEYEIKKRTTKLILQLRK